MVFGRIDAARAEQDGKQREHERDASVVSEYQCGAAPGVAPVSTSMLMEMAVSCSAMYGMIAVSAMSVTSTPMRRERPKRADRKSEIEVAFWCLARRTRRS